MATRQENYLNKSDQTRKVTVTDKYLNVSQSSFGQKIFNLVGLPVPPTLKRAGLAAVNSEALVDDIFIGDGDKSQVNDTLQAILSDACVSEHEAGAGSANQSKKYGGLVFDATSIKTAEDSVALYQFFHHKVKSIKASGKVVVIGVNPKQCANSLQASVQRGLVGFVKALAKEVGRKGITANLIYANSDLTTNIASPLRFLLSHRSAYVNGQVITLNANEASEITVSWNKPLAGKVALVTGASRGIGAAIAQLLARDGAKVIGLDIPQAEAELKATMLAIGGDAIAVNISDNNAAQFIEQQIVKLVGAVDIVIHNAGITRDKMLSRMTNEGWQQVMDVNLASVERINRYLLENKRINSGGSIVCVSSISGIAGNLGQSNYAMSKAGIIGMIESMSAPLAEQNITINAVAPGFIETQMTASIPVMTRFFGRRMCALSQGGLPIDVAETISFLAAPQSRGISGNLIRVCGLNIMGA